MSDDADMKREPIEESSWSIDVSRLISPPWITSIAIAACVCIYLGLAATGQQDSWENVAQFGYLDAGTIWRGAYWATITSAFVHFSLWHLGFNVYWLWVLGKRIEREIGSMRYLAFLLVSAFVSSALQLAASDTTGVGASGIVYGMFGFMWLARQRYPRFSEIINSRTVPIFIGWLLGCIVLTQMEMWQVGNTAHVSGLIFGAVVSGSFVLTSQRRVFRCALVALLSLAIVPLFWCPWSITWLSNAAYTAHAAGRYDEAIALYSKIVTLEPKNAWAFENRSDVNKLLGHLEKAREDMNRAREINSSLGEKK